MSARSLAEANGTRPGTLAVWLAAIRPATLTAALGPVAVGTALAAAVGKQHLGAAAAALLGAVFIQIGTNLFNDYADFEKGADTDERVGPARATQRGWLRPGQVLRGSIVSFALAALAGVYLIQLAGLPVVWIGIASVASGILYTGGPAPLAYRGLGDLFVLLFFGVVAVCGTYFVQASSLEPAVVPRPTSAPCSFASAHASAAGSTPRQSSAPTPSRRCGGSR
jgi:1,4-dihydroxy-2-naphthoate octaprenyltransferase